MNDDNKRNIYGQLSKKRMINDMPLPQISERIPVKKNVTKSPKAIKMMTSSGNTEDLETSY